MTSQAKDKMAAMIAGLDLEAPRKPPLPDAYSAPVGNAFSDEYRLDPQRGSEAVSRLRGAYQGRTPVAPLGMLRDPRDIAPPQASATPQGLPGGMPRLREMDEQIRELMAFKAASEQNQAEQSKQIAAIQERQDRPSSAKTYADVLSEKLPPITERSLLSVPWALTTVLAAALWLTK